MLLKNIDSGQINLRKGYTVGKIISKILGLILVALQLLVSAIFCGILYVSNFLDFDNILIVVLVLLILVLVNLILQRWLISGIIGKFLALLLIAGLGYGSNMLLHTNNMLSDITTGTTQVDEINYFVLADDPAKTILDAADYTFGVLGSMDRENTEYAIQEAEKKTENPLKSKEYDSPQSLAEALYSKKVKAIILNQAYVDVLEDEDYPDFSTETRVLETVSKETEGVISAEEFIPADEICTTPFTVYISGCDQAGKMAKISRSDVNIIATVNPVTKQVILISTPRDYFVQLWVRGKDGDELLSEQKDKLTHAGIHVKQEEKGKNTSSGVETSMATLGKLYETDLSIYFRVNFTGFKDIIDALGGIEVDSDVAFTAGWQACSQSDKDSYTFTEGANKLDGGAALAFSRERHAFAAGDRQRGANQMKVIEGVMKKLQSTALLTNYAEVMSSISNSFETNLSSKQIQALVKMQMDDMASWNVLTYSVTGTDAKEYTYSSSSKKAYVMIPDESTVQKAIELVDKVCDGEELTKADLKKSSNDSEEDGDSDKSSSGEDDASEEE